VRWGRRRRGTGGPSELLLEIFGPDVGAHARTAPGVAALPFNLPVIVAGEVEVLR
jgi:hypothetical protein